MFKYYVIILVLEFSTNVAKLSQAPAQLRGAELALFSENPDHPPVIGQKWKKSKLFQISWNGEKFGQQWILNFSDPP